MTPVVVRGSTMIEIEISGPIPCLVPEPDPQAGRREARILARLHGHTVGSLTVDLPSHGLSPDELAGQVWAATEVQVRDHLSADSLPEPGGLTAAGLPTPGDRARCAEARAAVLDAAPAITVLIATRDRAESLRRCLRSVAELDYPNFDVLVVDNAPTTDDTRSLLEELDGRCGRAPVRYVREDRPGLARAHNRGLAEAAGEWVAITDDDVLVDRHWLTAIAESMTAVPHVACVTGLILAAELETPAQRILEQAGGFARGYTRRIYDTRAHRPADPLFPVAVGRLGSGANMAFNVDVLRSLGGFDAALGVGTRACGGDDLGAFLHVLASGYALVYQPSAVVWHFHRRGYETLAPQARNYGIGLGAYLTAAVLRHPELVPGMLRGAVAGVRHFVGRSSAKNAAKPLDFPSELERAERRGVLRGPAAYLSSLWENRYAGGIAAGRAVTASTTDATIPVQRHGRRIPAAAMPEERSDVRVA